MSSFYSGKTFIITGASSGIGEALAREIALQGGTPVLCARRTDRIETIAGEIKAQGCQALAYECDVTREGDVARVVSETLKKVSKIDGLIANAGFGVSGSFESLSVEDYRRQFETNVFGLIRSLKESLSAIRAAKGNLVLIGSVSGHISIPTTSAYSMSKFSVRALAESIRDELRPKGVTVTLISPGFVESEIRKVDNQGQFKSTAKDPVPAWLVVSRKKAAREILKAIACGKRERVVTGHGKVLVYLYRFFPFIFHFLTRMGFHGRPEPKSSH